MQSGSCFDCVEEKRGVEAKAHASRAPPNTHIQTIHEKGLPLVNVSRYSASDDILDGSRDGDSSGAQRALGKEEGANNNNKIEIDAGMVTLRQPLGQER